MNFFWKLFFISFFVLFVSCSSSDDKKDGSLRLFLTDAPVSGKIEKVEVTFEKIEISKAGEESGDGGWFVFETEMNDDDVDGVDENTIDLLTLNNGKLAEMGFMDLDPGQYNQIRFFITESSVTIDGNKMDMKLASNTVKLVRPFTIEEGITTELVADFNAMKSINKTGQGYLMTPVIRLIEKKTSGAIGGTVSGGEQTNVIVTAIKNGTEVAGTVAADDGKFLLGYLEPGTYNVQIAAEGFETVTVENISVEVGKTVSINDTAGTITLTPTNGGGDSEAPQI